MAISTGALGDHVILAAVGCFGNTSRGLLRREDPWYPMLSEEPHRSQRCQGSSNARISQYVTRLHSQARCNLSPSNRPLPRVPAGRDSLLKRIPSREHTSRGSSRVSVSRRLAPSDASTSAEYPNLDGGRKTARLRALRDASLLGRRIPSVHRTYNPKLS